MSVIEIAQNQNSDSASKISEARRQASRINGAKSRGPTTLDGKAQSRLNSLKHGMTGKGVVMPEELAFAVVQHRDELTEKYKPSNAEEDRLIEEAALAAARAEHAGHVEFAHRIAAADRAEAGWELDRAAQAEALGARLHLRPSKVVAELKTDRHGCEWLIKRWKGLAKVLKKGKTWDDAQKNLALDLLGEPAELREEHRISDPETTAETLLKLVRREVRRLKEALESVLIRRDALNREMAEQGVTYSNSAANWRLVRYERVNAQRFERCRQDLEKRREPANANKNHGSGKTQAQPPPPIVRTIVKPLVLPEKMPEWFEDLYKAGKVGPLAADANANVSEPSATASSNSTPTAPPVPSESSADDQTTRESRLGRFANLFTDEPALDFEDLQDQNDLETLAIGDWK